MIHQHSHLHMLAMSLRAGHIFRDVMLYLSPSIQRYPPLPTLGLSTDRQSSSSTGFGVLNATLN